MYLVKMALPEVLPQGCGSPQIRKDDLFSGEQLMERMTVFSNISLISGRVKKWTPPETPTPKIMKLFYLQRIVSMSFLGFIDLQHAIPTAPPAGLL